MSADTIISLVLALATIGMAYMGMHVTIHPAGESAKVRLAYKAGFGILAIVACLLVCCQSVRSERQRHAADVDAAALKEKADALKKELETQNHAINAHLDRQVSEIVTSIASRLADTHQLALATPVKSGGAALPLPALNVDFLAFANDLEPNRLSFMSSFDRVRQRDLADAAVVWDFGDGSQTTISGIEKFVPVSHRYMRSGTYSVTLGVSGHAGGTRHQITIALPTRNRGVRH